jgi:hypothetical protein
MNIKSALLILVVVGLSGWDGCDDLQQTKTEAKQQEPPPKVVHHFDQIARSEGSLAVDTATGQMCKTWDWYCSKPTFYNRSTKQNEDGQMYGVSCSAIAEMPTCKSISEQK